MINPTKQIKAIKKPTIGGGAGGVPVPLSRNEILLRLGEAFDFVHRKIIRGRITAADMERQGFLRLEGYLASVYLGGLKDADLDELKDRIKALEEKP